MLEWRQRLLLFEEQVSAAQFPCCADDVGSQPMLRHTDKRSEECTQTKDQINVCWSTVDNPVANLSDTRMNDTFSSLSSAKPSASSFPISLAQLQATATPTTSLPVSLSASSLSSATAASISATTTPSSSAAPVSEEKKGISGGAIGGIVGGVVGGLALIGVAGFLLFRRRKNNSKGEHAPIASGTPSEHEHGNPYELNAYQQQQHGMAEAPVPTEKYGHNARPGPVSPYRDVPEVQGSPIGQHVVHEMQGSAPVEMDGSTSARR